MIPIKNDVQEGCLRFSDKQFILNFACLISMHFCHFGKIAYVSTYAVIGLHGAYSSFRTEDI